MFFLGFLVVVGIVIGAMLETFFDGKKGELGSVLSVIISGCTSFLTGILMVEIGIQNWGGFISLAPMFAPVIAAIGINLLVRVFKR